MSLVYLILYLQQYVSVSFWFCIIIIFWIKFYDLYIEIFHIITSASAKGVKYVTMKKCKNPCICVHLFANFRTFLRLSSQYISGTCFLPHGDEITCKFGIINTKTCMCVCVCDESHFTIMQIDSIPFVILSEQQIRVWALNVPNVSFFLVTFL
jgi:hypothetical protein